MQTTSEYLARVLRRVTKAWTDTRRAFLRVRREAAATPFGKAVTRHAGALSQALPPPIRALSPYARAAAPFAVALAFGSGIWLTALHLAEGATERNEPPLLLHWLRDSTLALPLVFVAVLVALLVAGALIQRLRLGASHVLAQAAVPTLVALFASSALALANPLHEALFEAHEHGLLELPWYLHMVRDGALAYAVNLPIAVVLTVFMAVRATHRLPQSAASVPGVEATRPEAAAPLVDPASAASPASPVGTDARHRRAVQPVVVAQAPIADARNGQGLLVPAPSGAGSFYWHTSRRDLLKYSAMGAAVLGSSAAMLGVSQLTTLAADNQNFGPLFDILEPCFDQSPQGRPFVQNLPIPPVLRPVRRTPEAEFFAVTERRGVHEYVPGIRTPIWGYNGIVPGPTILARKGRRAEVTFTNQLPPNEEPGALINDPGLDKQHPFTPSSTVVHLHGINTDHSSDGYTTEVRTRGQSRTHHYPNNEYQRPATFWYHDHSIHITSQHVYRGLAAFYLLSDEKEDALNLPKGYGVHDIPLKIQDIMIDPQTGVLLHNSCNFHGTYGDVMTVNGKQQPRFAVANRKYRFRILNGSDSRQYLLALQKASQVGKHNAANEQFILIGNGQGLLGAPEETDRVHIVAAQRHEIVVDFSRYPIGTRLVLVNLLISPNRPKLFQLMAFDVTREERDDSVVPAVLRPPEHPADFAPPVRTRVFEFNRQGGDFSINQLQFDANRDDARPTLDTNEEWVLVNKSGGWGHPIHIHLGRFMVTSIEGRQRLPGEMNGFQDVVWLGPNQRIHVVHQFWNFTGRFVFHCHNGTHEDHDMMSQFNVIRR